MQREYALPQTTRGLLVSKISVPRATGKSCGTGAQQGWEAEVAGWVLPAKFLAARGDAWGRKLRKGARVQKRERFRGPVTGGDGRAVLRRESPSRLNSTCGRGDPSGRFVVSSARACPGLDVLGASGALREFPPGRRPRHPVPYLQPIGLAEDRQSPGGRGRGVRTTELGRVAGS